MKLNNKRQKKTILKDTRPKELEETKTKQNKKENMEDGKEIE